MLRRALGVMIAGGVVLAGCSKPEDRTTLYDAPKPLDQMSTPEWCAYYTNFLTNPQLTAKDRAIDVQRMRARGCATPT